jgi:ADP-ribosylglycohydrolase
MTAEKQKGVIEKVRSYVANMNPLNTPKILDRLFVEGTIRLQHSHLLASTPATLPSDLSWDRIEGMLLGLAIGDSLGNTTESQLPKNRQNDHGTIRDYLPNWHAGGKSVGVPSDDTQLAFWTLEQINQDKGFIPKNVAKRFCKGQIYGIGGTVQTFIQNIQNGVSWENAGPTKDAAGNGAIMRIPPVLLPHLKNPTPALWADIALAAMITHNDPASTGSCLALAHLLWETLRQTSTPEPEWWMETFCETLKPLEGMTDYKPRTPHIQFQGPLWRFTRERIMNALERNLSVRDACDEWYSGAYLLETVPSFLYVLCRHADDPEEAIIRAVNDTKDNDTVAAIVGSVVGALYGKAALPQRWREGLLGRTGAGDDGRVFEIIREARTAWWVSNSLNY